MNNSIKLWIPQAEINLISSQGYPNTYHYEQTKGCVEMNITLEQLQQWQNKKNITERKGSQKQILND